MSGKASIVFAHGIWADGSCFSKLIPALQAEGHEVYASQHGLNSLESDVAAVTFTLNRVPGPIVLVGHSYGGTLITKAGTHDRVGALVYIAALGPDEDETSAGLQAKFAQTPVFQKIEVADGRVWLGPGAIADFAGDLPEAEQKLVLATATPPAADLFDQQVSGVAWGVRLRGTSRRRGSRRGRIRGGRAWARGCCRCRRSSPPCGRRRTVPGRGSRYGPGWRRCTSSAWSSRRRQGPGW
jgi:pimeloyl-ACP methyl ester carboxylesterase